MWSGSGSPRTGCGTAPMHFGGEYRPGPAASEPREAFPDVPPLYVYYKIIKDSPTEFRVYFLGLSPAWSKDENAAGSSS